MRVLISGATGLIGSHLAAVLRSHSHDVVPLQRQPDLPKDGEAAWEPEAGKIDLGRAGPLDAAVHLAGESIAQRWTPRAKSRIIASRVDATRLLCEALLKLPQRPRTVLAASAVGYYGDRGADWVDESSTPGTGFLAELAQQWEAAAAGLGAAGVRVVHLRFGIVLSKDGGALAKMLPAFRLGVAGRLGPGTQFWSWIAIDDAVKAIELALENSALGGPLNLVSPQPVTNAEFTRTLAHVLHRPAMLPVPAAGIRLLFGEMGTATMLASCRARPAHLSEAGFQFALPALEPALRHVLARE